MITTLENCGVVRIGDVAAFLGASRTTAARLLNELKAIGLKSKGRGRGTHYSRDEFLEVYAKLDTRE